MTLGEKIKNRRTELGMSQEELARKVGYSSRSTIAKIEANINSIPQSNIETLAAALNISPVNLMGWAESESEKSDAPLKEDDLSNVIIFDKGEIYDVSALPPEGQEDLKKYLEFLDLKYLKPSNADDKPKYKIVMQAAQLAKGHKSLTKKEQKELDTILDRDVTRILKEKRQREQEKKGIQNNPDN